MGDNSGMIPRERGVKNDGNFNNFTSILNLEQQHIWSRDWLPTANSSIALGCEKVKPHWSPQETTCWNSNPGYVEYL